MLINKEDILKFNAILFAVKEYGRLWIQGHKPEVGEKGDSFLSIIWQGYCDKDGGNHLCHLGDNNAGYILFYDSDNSFTIDYYDDENERVIVSIKFSSLGKAIRFINTNLNIDYDHGLRGLKKYPYPTERHALETKYRDYKFMKERLEEIESEYHDALVEYSQNQTNGIAVGAKVEILKTGEIGYIISRIAYPDDFYILHDISEAIGNKYDLIGYHLKETELEIKE